MDSLDIYAFVFEMVIVVALVIELILNSKEK